MIIGSPHGLILTNVLLSFYEAQWLEQCPKEFKPVFVTKDMLMAFLPSSNHLKCSQNFEIILILVIFEQEKNVKLIFLDIEVFREKGKLATSVNRKPTFRSVYTHFESLFPTVYKFGMAYTLA